MLDALLLVAGAALGAAATWAAGRRRARERVEAQQRAALDRDRAEARARYLDRRLEVRTRQLDRATKERDDYATIASTHRIEPRGFGKGQWVRKVWKDRRYSGHPADNLAHLRDDFAVFGQEHVLLTLDIELLGGWKGLLGDDDGSPTTPLSAGQSMLFEGPADRVLQQLGTFLLDGDTGFVVPCPPPDPASEPDADELPPEPHAERPPPRWRDPDSPMIWRFTVDVLEGQAAPPEVEFVEVLRIQEKVVEAVIERPVVRTVPPELTSHLCGHTTEEIVTLIEAVLEVRELGHGPRVEAEAKVLEGFVPDQGPPALPE